MTQATPVSYIQALQSPVVTPSVPTDSKDWTVNAEFETALDDVHTRFLLNLPASELATTDRIFFQLEQAWWFYEDMICDNSDIKLPRFGTLKPFAKILFEYSPLFPASDSFPKMWAEFSAYKRKIGTYGTVLLNEDATHIVLCQMWNDDTWTLPAGKINQGESGIMAAVRETFEETGFDPHAVLGLAKDLAPTWTNPLDENWSLSYQESSTGKRRTAYICKGVPMDFPFAPVARKEVSQVRWFSLKDMPAKTFAVLPFIGRLKFWKKRNLKGKSRPKSTGRDKSSSKSRPKSTTGRDKSRDKSRGNKSSSRSRTRSYSGGSAGLMKSGLVDSAEDKTRWTEEEMFQANEDLLGKKVDYDGDPHFFSDHGFAGNDPHNFRVVGGSFMNSIAVSGEEGLSDTLLANQQSAQPQEKYQSLVYNDDKSDDVALTPFFSTEGETPWGEVVEEAAANMTTNTNTKKKTKKSKQRQRQAEEEQNLGRALLEKLQKSSPKQASGRSTPTVDDVLIDAAITKKSQQEKLADQKYKQDIQFIQNWVGSLKRPSTFKINIDHVLQNI